MSTSTITVKKGTTAEWTSSNRVLDDGELGVEITENGNRIIRVGDGKTEFMSLSVATEFGELQNVLNEIDNGKLNQKINVEKARIDQITKMEEGSTTGDVELQDIRVGANGVTYESAGAAVRGQCAELNETLVNDYQDALFIEYLVDYTIEQKVMSYDTLIKTNKNSAYETTEIDVIEGQRYIVDCLSLDANYCGAFCYNTSDNSKVKLLAGTRTQYKHSIVTIPTGMNKLVLNNLITVSEYPIYIEKYFGEKYTSKLLDEKFESCKNVLISNLPDYAINSLSFKPLGELSKGYICLTCDDGTSGLATYTIPMLIEKNVTCTFGLIDNSSVVTNDTHRAVLLNALNHGCAVAMHGQKSWSTYTESELYEYFSDTKKLFEEKGIENVGGAICPGVAGCDDTTKLIQAVAGGMFGAVCSGGTHGEISYGNNYCAGARTNMYAMRRMSAIRFTEQTYKQAIDYAYDNHLILLPFWHDYEIVNNEEYQSIIEGMIDYAKEKGIEFITLGQISSII